MWVQDDDNDEEPQLFSLATLHGCVPRAVALLTIALFLANVGSIFVLVSLPNILICDAVVAGVVVLSLFAVGGSFLGVLYLLPSLLRSEWPWEPPIAGKSKARGSLNDDYYQELESAVASAVTASLLASAPASSSARSGNGSSGGAAAAAAAAPGSGGWLRTAAFRAGVCLAALACAATLGLAGAASWLGNAAVSSRTGTFTFPGALRVPARLQYSPDEGLARVTVGVRGGGGAPRSNSSAAAAAEQALFFSQGVAHARARLWQMEFQRRVGAGRLSEAVGAAGLPVDRAMRTLGVYRAAARDFLALNASRPAAARALQSYADGVNAYVAAEVGAGRYLPLEFRLLGLGAPEPWTPADSLVWSKMMSWDLSGNLDAELQRFWLRFGRGVAADRVEQLLPPFNDTFFPTVLEDGDPPCEKARAPPAAARRRALQAAAAEAQVAELLRGARARAAPNAHSPPPPLLRPCRGPALCVLSAALSLANAVGGAALALLGKKGSGGGGGGGGGLPATLAAAAAAAAAESLRGGGGSAHAFRRGRLGASNNWVVGGNNAAREKPLLANDPHLELMAPSLWYLMHLSAPEAGIDVIGASFPGLPGIVIGRNAHIAWGVTNTGVDVQDLYVMEDAGYDMYKFDGANRSYNVVTEVIKVAGGADVELEVRSSVHGPVVTDAGTGDGIVGRDVFGMGATLCLRWVSTDEAVADTTFAAFYGLQFARNFSEFRDALRDWVAPSQNVVFASSEGSEGGGGRAPGDIGYQMPGWVPLRNLSVTNGAWPAPGNSSAFTWLPESPWDFDALPCTKNPKRGFIVRVCVGGSH
jgi:penicillin amidase